MGTTPDRVQLNDLQRNVRALRGGGELFGLSSLEQVTRTFDAELTRYIGMGNLSDVEVRRCRYGVADLEAAVIGIERQFHALLGTAEDPAAAPTAFPNRGRVPASREELRVAKRASLVQLAGLLVQPVRSGLAATTRMVVPMARRRGIDVRFTVQGEDVPVDQAHLEVLNHVLPHLLRFACDHGFDRPEARLAAGKPETPMLTLAVERRDRSLVVTVADDGGGIDPADMRTMAVEQGLMSAEQAAALDDTAAQGVIFGLNYDHGEQSPSGSRGVGLNLIVRRLQDELHADVAVQSVPGQGTVVTITIPLSML
jgi:two-component system chemotaxis sensor kinase CheA